tara:strand:+ start:1610 stop:2002 length:393 start_codon:yes stop_codon:yes gene_type:complete
MFSKTTNNINISVKPYYLEDQSIPEEHHYVWAYQITINNLGNETVQLKERYWEITESNGSKKEVKGAGVIGEQPILKPGEKYEYTSGAPLTTPSGFMEGHYKMETKEGNKFSASVPLFSLDSPHSPNQIN